MRLRAAERIAILNQWWGERAGLTAADAATRAGVSTKRFYQMAAAWRRQPGLLAIGAYAAATPDRSSRIHPLVNAALQANVYKVVAENHDRSIEWLRRKLEEIARSELPAHDEDGRELRLPSANLVRAVITREINRVSEAKRLGESLAMDCCPTTMRSATGVPYALFVVIDRGTLRIIGSAIGSIDQSGNGYARAARRALTWLFEVRAQALPWAQRTRRVDVVVGRERSDFERLVTRYVEADGAIELQPVTGSKRFGSQLRRYVGDRVGRVLLRPTWVDAPAYLDEGEEVFDFHQASERAEHEVALYNEAKALERPSVAGSSPPEELVEFLRITTGGPEDAQVRL